MKANRWINLGVWVGLLVLVGYVGLWQWMVCRVYVSEGESLLVMYKGALLGRTDPAKEGEFAAVDDAGNPLQAGFLKEMAGPGRHFRYDPIHYKVERIPDIAIDIGQVGVVTCKLGQASATAGEFLVEGDIGQTNVKGVLRKVLTPGRYRVNLYGYDVSIYNDHGDIVETVTLDTVRDRVAKKPARTAKAGAAPSPPAVTKPRGNSEQFAKRSGWVDVPTGYVGVLTNLRPVPQPGGADLPAGIQDEVLQPGLYPVNPFAQQVDIFFVGYQELTVKGDIAKDAKGDVKLDENGEPLMTTTGARGVNFPSSDGFQITVDFTTIWGLMPEQAPKVLRRFGDLNKVEKEVILTDIGNICRLQGSKLGAVDLLAGESREKFQTDVSKDFARLLADKDLSLLVGLVRHIHIPPQVRAPIQKANTADESRLTRDMQTLTATVEAELEEARQSVIKESKRVQAETEKKFQSALAEGGKEVELIKAKTDREVATIAKETAELDAKATVFLGEAQAKAEQLKREAEAQKLTLAVAAFGTPDAYNQYVFANGLPADLRLVLLYAGPGTFWTDLKSFQDASLGKLMQSAKTPGADAK